ncbi:MAG TPA: hypothetical protein VGW38_29400 [Chloroflexota bacterium]|nr:hypothetical protein [Chloroflexota bacterium]
MIHMKKLFGSAALVALISGSTLGLAMAQDKNAAQPDQAQTGAQTAPATGAASADSAQQGNQSGGQQTGSAGQQATAGGQPGDNRLIVTVNDVEIRQADVLNAIQNLPPQVQQMPPQMLLPIVVKQLLTRELILDRGRAENLQTDPAVLAIVKPQTQALEDQAVVNVWIERELAERVTEERINAAYEQFRAANPDSTVTLAVARPQLEQALRQEAMRQLSAELRSGASIVFYDASGNPVPANTSGQTGAAGGENNGAGQTGGAGAPSSSAPAQKK